MSLTQDQLLILYRTLIDADQGDLEAIAFTIKTVLLPRLTDMEKD